MYISDLMVPPPSVLAPVGGYGSNMGRSGAPAFAPPPAPFIGGRGSGAGPMFSGGVGGAMGGGNLNGPPHFQPGGGRGFSAARGGGSGRGGAAHRGGRSSNIDRGGDAGVGGRKVGFGGGRGGGGRGHDVGRGGGGRGGRGFDSGRGGRGGSGGGGRGHSGGRGGGRGFEASRGGRGGRGFDGVRRGGRGGKDGGRSKGELNGITLPKVDFSNIIPFEKNFYVESASVQAMSEQDAELYRRSREITVEGRDIPKPIRHFQETNFPGFPFYIRNYNIFWTCYSFLSLLLFVNSLTEEFYFFIFYFCSRLKL